MSWLFEALAEYRNLSKMRSPATPFYIFCGEMDQLVHNSPNKARMAKWPNSEFAMIRNAKHDVLIEIPGVGGDVMTQIFEFFAKVTSADRLQRAVLS